MEKTPLNRVPPGTARQNQCWQQPLEGPAAQLKFLRHAWIEIKADPDCHSFTQGCC